MKQFFILFLGILFSAVGHSQDITTALKNGNAAEAVSYFDTSTEVTLEGKSTTTNKKNAEVLLRNFFKNVGVKNFVIIHKSGTTAAQYYIGNLTTNSGIYRTTIFMKQKDNKSLVQEITFEK